MQGKREIDTALVARAYKYVKDNGLDWIGFAESLGISRSLASSYIQGSYGKYSRAAENALNDFFAKLDAENQEVSNDGEFTKTLDIDVAPKISSEKNWQIPLLFISDDAGMELALCRSCQENGYMGMIVGKTGYGKTHVVKEYVQTHNGDHNVFRIECDSGMTVTDLVDSIEEALMMPSGGGQLGRRIKNIVKYLNSSSERLLIIDEADKLMTKNDYKDGYKKMEIIRGIYDKLDEKEFIDKPNGSIEQFIQKNRKKAGILFVGETALLEKTSTLLPRLRRRCAENVYMMEGLSKSEVYQYLSNIDFTPEALTELVICAKQGGFSRLDGMVKSVLEGMTARKPITLEDVHSASGARAK